MPSIETFKSDPRVYILELLEEGHDANEMVCKLANAMSFDECKSFCKREELAPEECDLCDYAPEPGYELCRDCRNEKFVDEIDSGTHDKEALQTDIENGNFDIDDDDVGEYEHETIVNRSFETGQFTEAKNQCSSYGMDYELLLAEWRSENDS